jgi:hypothetical protein
VTRKIYLHVGAPKTGTTYLQNRLYLNRAELSRNGIDYPVGLHADMFGAAVDLIEQTWGGQSDEAVGYWDALVRRVKRTRGTVVISHEILASASPAQIERVMADLGRFEVHIVYTARDLARQVPAEWQERIKHRATTHYGTYLRRITSAKQSGDTMWFWQVQGLPDVLTRWGTNLPPDRLHVITVPQPGGPHEELWLRFCRVIGIDPAWAPLDSDRVNSSMGAAETTMLRRLNTKLAEADLDQRDYRLLVREVVAHQALAKRDNATRVTLPPELYDWAEETAGRWIEWLQGAGVDVVGDVDELRPRRPGPESRFRAPGRARSADVAEAALDALVAVLEAAARRPDPDETLPAQVRKTVRRMRGGS